MEKDLIYNGIRVGEYGYDHDEAMRKIKEECIDVGMNYVAFNLSKTNYGKEYYVTLAKYLADNGIYFTFQYVDWLDNPAGFDEEISDAMKEVAGKYYRAHGLGELGTKFGCAAKGYGDFFGRGNKSTTMQEGKDGFDDYVKKVVERGSFGGKVDTFVTDATCLLSYAAPFTAFPALEMVCGNPEIMVPQIRALARAYASDCWSTYVAHEWYGGTKTLDPIKMKRLKMYYEYAYMQGSKQLVLESGDECLWTHETHPTKCDDPRVKSPHDTIYDRNHPICVEYRNVLKNFSKLVNDDCRPVGGPKVKVAFVQGNLDGFSSWRAGSSLWNIYDNKDFGYSAPEFVWRLFDDISAKRNWADTHNFGEVDLSGAPAYGTYDIVPAMAGYEAFKRYDYLIFTGWNTMTDELYEDLKKFVSGGGRLFMCASHLNTSSKRDGEIKLVKDGKVEELFGCELSAEEKICTNNGIKYYESIVPEFMWPASTYFDPIFSEGYINYAKATLKGGTMSGYLSDAFKDKEPETLPAALVENKYGEGYAVLMTNLDYPGCAGYSAYKALVREIITASHRLADIKIYGGDRLRFTVYEGNKVYLLNTDFDCQVQAIIDTGAKKLTYTLEPMEFKIIEPEELK